MSAISVSREEETTSPYRLLYIVGGVAALTAVLLFRRNLSAELLVSNGFGIFDVPAYCYPSFPFKPIPTTNRKTSACKKHLRSL